MTNKELERGIELQKIIKECEDFYEVFDRINSKNCDQSQISIIMSARSDAATINLSKCPNVVDAIKYQLRAAISAYKEEFKAL